MRSDEVIESVRDAVQTDQGKIEQIINSVRGGWEGWLQVEGTMSLLSRLGVGAIANREECYPVPDNGKRADIVLHPRKGTAIYVELKVQNAFQDNVLTRFHNDIIKITNLSSSTRHDYVVVALAYMQWFDPGTLKSMRGILGGTLLVQQWNGSKWIDTTDNPVNGPNEHPPTLASFKLH